MSFNIRMLNQTLIGILIAVHIIMPYLPRYLIISDGSFFHVTWKCHNSEWLLRWDWAKKFYYDLLLKYKDKYGVEFYSYNFMDNHPHLTGHLAKKEDFSALFRIVNCLFAKAINKYLKRTGQVVMDRFKSPRIESDRHMLNVMIYTDLNQHRVGKVSHPRSNEWSSYRYYAYGEKDPLITPSPTYLALGDTPLERQGEYRALVEIVIANREFFNISHTHFIGNPDWIIVKYRQLREQLKNKSLKSTYDAHGPPI